jgi:hypothetical protein
LATLPLAPVLFFLHRLETFILHFVNAMNGGELENAAPSIKDVATMRTASAGDVDDDVRSFSARLLSLLHLFRVFLRFV